MNKQKKLVLARGIFAFIVFVLFGVIVLTEKAGGIMIPRVEKKMNTYIDENYKDTKDNLNFKKITFKNTTYTMKVESKENKNHYFYITYFNRKMSDTYKKDYIEGNNLLTYIKDKLEKEIKELTDTNCTIEIPNKLNEYTSKVQERIIKEDNLLELKFYIIKKELIIDNWDKEFITNKIVKTINNFKTNNITPKEYKITITNKEDITKSIEIVLDDSFIDNTNNKEIINDIMNKKKSDLLNDNNITYKYLN